MSIKNNTIITTNYFISPLTFIMKFIIDTAITNVELPDAPLLWYSSELHVAPQYISQITSTSHVAIIK